MEPTLLKDEEIALAAKKMTDVAVAIFSGEEDLVLPYVVASRPLTPLELWGLKKLPGTFRVYGLRFAPGLKNMEGVVFRDGDQIKIAARVYRFGLRRTRADYWVFTVKEYITWLIDPDFMSIHDARRVIARAQWQLQGLLPRRHPLCTQPFVPLKSKV